MELLIRLAHARGIRVHAWINLLSLGTNKDALILRKYGVSILTRNLKPKKSIEDYKIDDQYFLEPGDLWVRFELAGLVAEIVARYPGLDGIQFDYIRYPDKHPFYGYTKINVDRFKEATGREAVEEYSDVWNDWKRAQVTELLELLVRQVRKARTDIQVSTTACAPFVRAYKEAFQDWPSWLSSGLIDFVTLMSYSKDTDEFGTFVSEAMTKAEVSKVNVAVGAYALQGKPELFRQQIRICESRGSRSCVVFHYGSMLESPALADVMESE